jgi:hypothetical protein
VRIDSESGTSDGLPGALGRRRPGPGHRSDLGLDEHLADAERPAAEGVHAPSLGTNPSVYRGEPGDAHEQLERLPPRAWRDDRLHQAQGAQEHGREHVQHEPPGLSHFNLRT